MCRTKTYIDFMNVVSQYCEDMGFRLEYDETRTGWVKYNTYHYDILVPTLFGWECDEYGHPVEWYNNEFFRKLVEDNGGVCPLPLTQHK